MIFKRIIFAAPRKAGIRSQLRDRGLLRDCPDCEGGKLFKIGGAFCCDRCLHKEE